jgi:peroxiredoxin family protein/TusA-related sulfurtransferase
MESTISHSIDCRGVKCPMPIVMLSKAMRALDPGQRVCVESDDPAFRPDLEAWVKKLGYALIEFDDGPIQRAVVEKRAAEADNNVENLTSVCARSGVSPSTARLIDDLVSKAVSERFGELEKRIDESLARSAPREDRALARETSVSNQASIVVFSGDMDRLMAAFIIATGAASMEMDVSLFFSFWGLAALKKDKIYKGKALSEKLVTAMLPTSAAKLGTSKMNMLGMGPAFFRKLMKKNGVESLPELIERSREMGVKFIACKMSMDVMGVREDELIDGVELGGVATFVGSASDSRITLFI